MIKSTRVNNWSRYPVIDTELHSFRTSDELREFLTTTPKFIARGSGLSYGDASLAPVILSTLHFNKMLFFDKQQGIIRCESGVTLGEILKVIVPAGWFLPVAPGTKFITLGGAVASDIHGKNHHKEGSITQYVTALTLMVYNGEIIDCSPSLNSDIFHSTCGGMGLSGVIMDIEIKLKRIQTAYIAQRNIIAPNLHSLIRTLKDNGSYTYSVSWIDCISTGSKMGRGVVMLGEHATREDLDHKFQGDPLRVHQNPKFSVPFDMPSFVLNQFSIGMFNRLYYAMHSLSARKFMIHYDKFFFPLDFIRDWNRLYGHRGLLQYQFVIPFEDGERTMTEILKGISKSKLASFLSVLKLLSHSEHTLSFPMPGFTLALDFPISDELFQLLDELDQIVSSNGGRLYLAKDVRMKRETFAIGYPDAEKFSIAVRNTSSSWKFESLLSKRLSITK